MPSPDSVLAAVVVTALMDARWESAELLSRRSSGAAPELLRARAAELSLSASGREQVLGLALAAAADDVEQARSPLGDGALFFFAESVGRAEQLRWQRAVLALAGTADARADALVRELEAAHRQEGGQGVSAAELACRLREDALLHKRLWDDPRIPADAPTRLVMLCAIPRLVDRSRALDPRPLRSLHDLIPWPAGRRRWTPA